MYQVTPTCRAQQCPAHSLPPSTRKKLLLWSLLLLLLAAAAFAAWSFLHQEPEVHRLTETVHRGDLEQSVSATGDIVPALLVNVGTQATGQINHFYVHLGQQVEKGQLIAVIDSATQKGELDKARASLASLQAQLAGKKVSLATAQKNYTRERNLWKKHATSQKEYEAAADTLAAAKSAITELESSIRSAEISISTAETDLGYTRITAPVAGTIVSTAIEEGQTLNSAESSPTIVQIADLSKMVIRMQVAEGDITRVKPGQSVHFSTLADPENRRTTTLSSIDPGLTTLSQGGYTTSTDPTSSAIYYYARAAVENHDNRLRIGMTVETSIVTATAKDVLLVPTLAIRQTADGPQVTVLEEDEPQPRRITTGPANAVDTVVLSGLKEGEVVITDESVGEAEAEDMELMP